MTKQFKLRKWYLLIDDSHLVHHGATTKKACRFVKHMMEANAKNNPSSKFFWGNLKIIKVQEKQND